MLRLLSSEAQSDLVKLIDERVAQQLGHVLPTRPDTPWMTPAEAALQLRTTPGAIYKRIKRGQLTAHRPDGSRILLRRTDIDATGPEAEATV